MLTSTQATFFPDADGTLTDSIAAVEPAWSKVALDIGQDPTYAIAATTHGKCATHNLTHFKPHIKAHEMDDEVQVFEESILFFADAYSKHGSGWQEVSSVSSDATAPSPSSGHSSASSSHSQSISAARPVFLCQVTDHLAQFTFEDATLEDGEISEAVVDWREELQRKHAFEAWQIEATAVDCSVRILPGVKDLMDPIPEGRYVVATSWTKTYAYGCKTRVGTRPPKVTITADDKRLKAGKPAPDPFLLAAKELRYAARDCVVFEDSPSGIRAGVASGAIVIAVCTNHESSKIEGCGADFIADTMEQVLVVAAGERLKFVIAGKLQAGG